MKIMTQLMLTIAIFINASINAKTICHEPSENINKFHLVWLGAPVNKDLQGNVKILCQQIDKYLNSFPEENFILHIWTDENSLEVFPSVCDVTKKDRFTIQVDNVSNLLSEDKKDQYLYDYFLAKKNYAPASDYLRVRAVKLYGGCYMDIGTKINSNNLFEKELKKSDSDVDKFYVSKGDWTYLRPEDPRIDAIAGPKLNLFNNFFAAEKNNNLLELLLKEYSFKNDFFNAHRPIIDLLYEHCSTDPIVMSLIGQYAYNDFFRSLLRDKDLKDKVVILGLMDALPYSGKASWARQNQNDCGFVVAALYNDFRDKDLKDDLSNLPNNKDLEKRISNLYGLDMFRGFSEDKNIFPYYEPGDFKGDHQSLIKSGIMLYDVEPTILAADYILKEILRSYRKGMRHPAMEKFSADYVEKLKQGIKARSNINKGFSLGGYGDLIICQEVLREQFPDTELKFSHPGRTIPIILKASLIKKLNIATYLKLYDESISSPFSLDNPDGLYFGFLLPSCGNRLKTETYTYFPIFIPLYKIGSDFADIISRR